MPSPEPTEVIAPGSTAKTEPPVWPYVVPLAAFLALSTLESYLPTAAKGAPSPVWYPLAYAVKVAVVAGLFWPCRSILRDLSPWPSAAGTALSVGLGLAVTAIWVGLDGHYPTFKALGERQAFDPATMPPAARAAFLTVRMLGLVVLIPLVEELFYRSFVMRYVVDPDYRKVPIGRVTPLGLGVTTAVFGLSHPEWLPAVLTGLAWGWLVARTKSVSACVLSHATANLALGIYVLYTHDWKWW